MLAISAHAATGITTKVNPNAKHLTNSEFAAAPDIAAADRTARARYPTTFMG